jgi:hypothetical protein
MTKIKSCTCTSKQQDDMYGAGNRVMNTTVKTNPTIYRCTVCGKTTE